MTKYSIRDLALAGRRVFLRVDFNVPIKHGVIGDDTRITSSLPTIRYALDKGATVVLASHLGRPKGQPAPAFSLEPVAAHLARLLGRPVGFAADCIGEPARTAVAAAHASGGSKIVLLENLRFHAGEEQNDPAFASELAALADVYVNDAFGAAHRAHASVAGIVACFDSASSAAPVNSSASSVSPAAPVDRSASSAAGLLMEKELTYLGMALGDPERPFVAVFGVGKFSVMI